jgi:hypothetical protein
VRSSGTGFIATSQSIIIAVTLLAVGSTADVGVSIQFGLRNHAYKHFSVLAKMNVLEEDLNSFAYS